MVGQEGQGFAVLGRVPREVLSDEIAETQTSKLQSFDNGAGGMQAVPVAFPQLTRH